MRPRPNLLDGFHSTATIEPSGTRLSVVPVGPRWLIVNSRPSKDIVTFPAFAVTVSATACRRDVQPEQPNHDQFHDQPPFEGPGSLLECGIYQGWS
jgi:hypothetical protein